MNEHLARQKSDVHAEIAPVGGPTDAASDVSRHLERERELEHLNRLYAALSELNRTIARVQSREELFHEACKIATEKAGFQLAWIGRPDGRTHLVTPIARGGNKQDYLDEIRVFADERPEGWGPVGRCIRERKVHVFNDFANDPSTAPWHAAAAARGFRSAASIPICFQGEVWGALTIYDSEANVFQVKEIALLEEVAAALSFAMDRLDDELRRQRAEESMKREHRTIKHLLESSDRERQVIAYEIHDGLAQYLTGAIMQFQAYEHAKGAKPDDAAAAFAAGMAMLRQSHAEARRLISGVRPPILDEEGIVAAVNHLVHEQQESGGPAIECRSQVEFSRLAPIMENAVYRIVQEGLTNACRHSRSDKVWVELAQHGEQLRIEIRDRGIGFRLDDVSEGRFGLHGMRERARLLGGTANIESAPGKGTRIVVELPVVRSAEEE